jgi:hypothetical protein
VPAQRRSSERNGSSTPLLVHAPESRRQQLAAVASPVQPGPQVSSPSSPRAGRWTRRTQPRGRWPNSPTRSPRSASPARAPASRRHGGDRRPARPAPPRAPARSLAR